jgi:carbamate kinase
MLVVVALGDKAVAHADVAARTVAALAAEHHVVVTYGHGSQAGLLALESAAYQGVPAYPLDVLEVESQGLVGHLLEQELRRHLAVDRLATLLIQVIVDRDDPAFDRPATPVGPRYDGLEAERLARARGWVIAPDGEGWRRVVASPRPTGIVELPTIRILVDHGVTVVCAGGGGIPVAPTAAGDLRGVEAVIADDLAAARLAIDLDADALLMLTGVEAVYAGGGRAARPLGATSPDELRSLPLRAASMAPKVDAICAFVAQGGWIGGIGAVADGPAILRGQAGTRVGAGAGVPATAGRRTVMVPTPATAGRPRADEARS